MGLTLRQCKRKVTHSEYLTWMAWYDLQWNEPSRTDKYLMQIAAKIHNITEAFAKAPKYKQTEDMVLDFAFDDTTKPKAIDIDHADLMSKARWGVILGRSPRTGKPTKPKG